MSRLDQLTAALARSADQIDRTGDWPADAMQRLNEFDCWQWAIPARFGGAGLSPADAIAGYEAIAKGSMAVALIFTQHDAAVDVILNGENAELKEELAPKLARGQTRLTVGIAQLTTSRQGGEPAMKVSWDGQSARFDGLMPWSTAPDQCHAIVTGGLLDDGRQLLALVPTDAPGMRINPPMELAALQSTRTTAVHCDGVTVGPDSIIRGPAERALATRAPVRPLVVSACGVGLAGAMVSQIQQIRQRRSAELCAVADGVVARYDSVRQRLYAAADMLGDPSAEMPASDVRVAVNDVVIRLAVLTTTLAKGTGYLRSHPVQRLVREAFFFLVWSAPESVQLGTLRHLLG